eukprot:CAMPEP_0182556362 /NCGR_PEP_ID=MMETSP1324-20130603/650_1 /TAXON_ID=236786 /ORGANISM="Florenciella sp., Strain RCC1587" /LENGTH=552 /DNA_ID=CAMNT_0024768235 /DNA_START=103 /DNA_END=1761 /DNA_ORIENTATION=+
MSAFPKAESADVVPWVERKSGQRKGGMGLGPWLKNGEVLCALANSLQAGIVKNVNHSPMPFKQMENISNFLKAARKLGVRDGDCFETADLYDEKDLNLVIQCLDALKRRAEAPAGGGSKVKAANAKLGGAGTWMTAKPSAATPEVAKHAPVTGYRGAGSSLMTEAGQGIGKEAAEVKMSTADRPNYMNISKQGQAEVNITPIVKRFSAGRPVQQAPRGTPASAVACTRTSASTPPSAAARPTDRKGWLGGWGAKTTKADTTLTPRKANPLEQPSASAKSPTAPSEVFKGAPKHSIEEKSWFGGQSGEGGKSSAPKKLQTPSAFNKGGASTVSVMGARAGVPTSASSTSAASWKQRQGMGAAATPAPSSSPSSASTPASGYPAAPTRGTVAARADAHDSSARGGGHGMDAELATKQQAKLATMGSLEADVVGWVQSKTGSQKGGQSLAAWLKDGQVLCALTNGIQAGSVKRVETSSMPFKQRENVANFLQAARKLGVRDGDCFETADLYDEKDLGGVIQCLDALKRQTAAGGQPKAAKALNVGGAQSWNTRGM